jgi:hypothetical protein
MPWKECSVTDERSPASRRGDGGTLQGSSRRDRREAGCYPSTGTWIAQFSKAIELFDECCSATIRIAQSVRSQQTSRQSLPTRDWNGSQLFAAQFRKRLERLGTIMKGQRQKRLALDLVFRGWTRALARPSC